MRIFLFLSLFVFCSATTFAQNGAGWMPLFNGKNLDGWTASTENANSFFVENGTLILKGGRAHLFYTGSDGKANFTNFELRLKIKTLNNSNSGVYFQTQYQESGWPEKGFEAQVNSTHTDPRKTGSLYGIVNIYSPGPEVEPFVGQVNENGEVFLYQKKAPSKDKKWFDYHITVVDNTVTIRVDGKIQTKWTQPEDWAPEGRRINPGTIALQAHDPGCEVHYKDIQLKVLD
jgi:hypothetical protein